jgi:glycosyltransferase involved in cell wall biosynthesis
VTEPDCGQSYAINKGWSIATGDILAYLNSDDSYLDNAVAAAVENFSGESQPGIVYGNAVVVDRVGNPLRIWQAERFDLKRMLAIGNSVPQPATFFSRLALDHVGCLDETGHMIVDYEFCIRVGMHLPTVCLPTTLARFRDHAQSKSRSRFDVTAKELVHFVSTFETTQLSRKELKTIKQAALSRVHFEWALAYLAEARPQKLQALGQLYQSIRVHPWLALKRPLQTGYIVKELLLSRA